MIAIIYEGERAEPRIWKSIKALNITGEFVGVHLEAAFCDNIYSLYDILHKDDSMDIVSLVQEKIRNSKNQRVCKKFQDFLNADRDQFSEVYLFFDFDLHHTFRKNTEDDYVNNLKTVEEMLLFFDNETEEGKLYISYPMVESLKDLSAINICDNRCCINYNESALYKRSIHENARDFQDTRKYNNATWAHFCRHALMKANCIVASAYKMIDYKMFINTITQYKIFCKQRNTINQYQKIYILSAFPLFLLEYFGEKSWKDNGILMLEDNNLKLLACEQCKQRIPFEISADPFYSDEHMSMLEQRIDDIEHGRNISQHELIEVE